MNTDMFKSLIEESGQSLQPNEDWPPTIFMENAINPNEGGEPRLNLAFVVRDLFSKEIGTDRRDSVISALIATAKPSAVCVISAAWLSSVDVGMSIDEVRAGKAHKPSEDPNKEEVVLCVCVGQSGEMEGETIMIGRIERSNGPPKIKSWDIQQGDGEATFEGRLIDAVKLGLEISLDPRWDKFITEKMKEDEEGDEWKRV